MELRFAKPEEMGFDKERLQVASRVICRGLEAGLYPGAAFILGRRGRVLEPQCFGYRDPEGTAQVSADTVYDVASLTKPVATAASVVVLLERGELHLGQPVSDLFPGQSLPHLSRVTVRHLLTHTSGLPAYKDFHPDARGRDEIIAGMLSTPLDNPPGTAYMYSCVGYVLLGAVVEAVSGSTLDAFAKANVFRPLDMKDTDFNPCPEALGRTATTSNCPARKRTPVGEVHDRIAWALGGVGGNAGLFSTTLDLARFSSMLLEGGRGILSPLGSRLAFENLLDTAVGGHTAGWFIYPNDMLVSGDFMSRQTIGHSGFTGTSAVIDPACDLFVILLTNRVCNGDDGNEFRKTRRLFHNAVAQAVSN